MYRAIAIRWLVDLVERTVGELFVESDVGDIAKTITIFKISARHLSQQRQYPSIPGEAGVRGIVNFALR